MRGLSFRISDREAKELQELLGGVRPTLRRLKDALAGKPIEVRATPSFAPTTVDGLDDAALAGIRQVIAQAPPLTEIEPARPGIATLDAAADILLGVLEPRHADVVREVSDENGLPCWIIILGAVARGADHRELHAGDFHEWINQPDQRGEVVHEVRCTVCALVIPNARRGQVACCANHGCGKPEHNEACAAAAVDGVSPIVPAQTHGAPAGPVGDLAASGHCRACGLTIIDGRPGQFYCCSAHGSDKAEHSEGCLTAGVATLGRARTDALEAQESAEPVGAE